jgi:hypothetical protein
MKGWKERIWGAQSLDDLCVVLNEAADAFELEVSSDDFQSFTGLSAKDWTKLPLFGPDEWGLPEGVHSWDLRGNVLVHDNYRWQIIPLQDVQPVFYSGFDVAVEWEEDQDAWLVRGLNGEVVGQHDTPWDALQAYERLVPSH